VGFLARDVLYIVGNEETWRLKKTGIRHSKCMEQGGDGKEEVGRRIAVNLS
jgi:hypothetical protein